MPRGVRLFLVTTLLLLTSWITPAWRVPPVQAQTAPGTGTYTVVAGDTLGEIATRHGVTLEALIAANGILDPNLLEVGQVLTIPGAQGDSSGAALPIPDAVSVRARPGDTPARLAQRYGQSVETLTALNPISDTARLFPGQPLLLPRSAVTPDPLRFGAVKQVEVPSVLPQGRTGRVVVQTSRPLELQAPWNELPISFTPLPDDPLRQWAYLPAPALIAPSTYWLALSYTASNGLMLNRAWSIGVVEGGYPTEVLAFTPEVGALLDPILVQTELEKVTATWSQRSPEVLWSGVFSRPVDSQYPTTSAYGTRRSYDGGPVTGYHEGQDFGVPEGVPILSPGDGVVALAEPLTVRGNAVIIDHGRGVYTGYWHLSEIGVTPGQAVKTGDILGLVGNTGLSTGAHLHWELRIYGISVDPMQFTEEPLAYLP